MKIGEFIDRLMLEMGDIRGEKIKYADYFTIATEALKTIEAVYTPLFEIKEGTLTSGQVSEREISIPNDDTNKRNYFKVGRFSLNGERYQVDYEYAKITNNSFLPCYGFRANGNGINIAFSPGANVGDAYKAVVFYVHKTEYFTDPNNELELPENFVLAALGLAKQYLYEKIGVSLNQYQVPIIQTQGQEQQQ